jgi:hypothetical protein
VLKQRGAQAGQRVSLETPLALRRQLPLRERAAVVSAARLPQGEIRPRVPVRGDMQPMLAVHSLRERWQ